ncbi:membrane protein [Candidatus Scalindua japonica]|uniref:Membrane protein n=1 Tax=Candidatus Scalindua japonica TaxID=1284222 RepID=A0A286U2U9_9BACT|nr:YqaA family protein [Candidatus Scalindua japonica]GAX62468.1 membrane protein [Candidatus Scalindua japonica]
MESIEKEQITRKANHIRRLYDWTIHWAETPHSTWALFILAFCESSFFPIPPDVLLIALAVALPGKSFKYAIICSVGSILGGCFGYFIGYQFFEFVGRPIISFYNITDIFDTVSTQYHNNAFSAIAVAGFTPIPYKVFTIAAGACKINIFTLILASALSRSARFFLVAGLFYVFGPKIKTFIEKYFNILSIIFVILLISGFIAVKYLK